MKNFKKVTATIAATLMAATMIVPMAMNSFAADTTITVTDAANRTFEAYQLMTVKVSNGETKSYEYTVNEKYESILNTVLANAEGETIVEKLGTYTDKSAEMQEVADAIYLAIKEGKITADITNFTSGTATVADGYYLVVDTTVGLDDEVRSRVMVDTADAVENGVEINMKKAKPTFEKKIWDTNDTDVEMPDLSAKDALVGLDKDAWQDSADHDMRDAVPFKLTATLPADINLYDDYSIAFHDTLDANSWKFNNDVKIYLNGTEDVTDLFTVDTEKTADTFVIYDNDDNIMNNKWTLKGGDTIDVYYTAELTTEAVIGNPGNWNKANLEYTNDYYWTSGGEYTPDDEENKSKTPDDWVVAFTYQTVVDKIDSSYADLTGATFSLYKKVEGYAENDGWKKLDTITGTELSKFEFKGIDDGQYKIVEDEAPDGYSKAADIEFTVTATHSKTVETRVEDGVLTELEVNNTELKASLIDAKIERKKGENHDAVSGEIYTEVVNQSGTKLPSTGGIGTTLFYLGGGAMVAVAGVFLITKRRMKKEEL
ncbi:MAG: LPXTG cell wall anchor domain-containing protein [Ruminococcus sp.]|nr:LPXTG cell wall anchor domain-containing protein [Ruminococcus sp.]